VKAFFLSAKNGLQARYLQEAIWELGVGKPLDDLMACANDMPARRNERDLPPFCRQDVLMSEVGHWFCESCTDREKDLIVIASSFFPAWTTLHIDCGTLGQAPSDFAREEVMKVYQAANRLGIAEQLLFNLSKKGHSFFDFKEHR
jgi:hypothetical protein